MGEHTIVKSLYVLYVYRPLNTDIASFNNSFSSTLKLINKENMHVGLTTFSQMLVLPLTKKITTDLDPLDHIKVYFHLLVILNHLKLMK